MSDFLTRLCQIIRDEVGFLLMPTWLKYTTIGPSQADCAVRSAWVKRVMLETKYVAGETVLELSYK